MWKSFVFGGAGNLVPLNVLRGREGGLHQHGKG